MKNKTNKLVLLLVVIIVVTFAKFTLTLAGEVPLSQRCRLNERIKSKLTIGVIDRIYTPKESKGALVFVLEDQTRHPFSKSAFRGLHNDILAGDSIIKPLGSLILTIKSDQNSYDFSLDKGCDN